MSPLGIDTAASIENVKVDRVTVKILHPSRGETVLQAKAEAPFSSVFAEWLSFHGMDKIPDCHQFWWPNGMKIGRNIYIWSSCAKPVSVRECLETYIQSASDTCWKSISIKCTINNEPEGREKDHFLEPPDQSVSIFEEKKGSREAMKSKEGCVVIITDQHGGRKGVYRCSIGNKWQKMVARWQQATDWGEEGPLHSIEKIWVGLGEDGEAGREVELKTAWDIEETIFILAEASRETEAAVISALEKKKDLHLRLHVHLVARRGVKHGREEEPSMKRRKLDDASFEQNEASESKQKNFEDLLKAQEKLLAISRGFVDDDPQRSEEVASTGRMRSISDGTSEQEALEMAIAISLSEAHASGSA